jgi:hypothetical protein
MSIETDAADILESAAFVIGTGHHAKGAFFDDHGWCALGAIREADGALRGDSQAHSAACHALYLVIGVPIAVWNDLPERTPEEVESAMLKAAAKLRGEA